MLQTDKYIILDSRVVLMDDSEATLFVPIVIDGAEQGVFEINFVNDNENPKAEIQKIVNGDELQIRCINLVDSLGRFTLEPVVIAHFDDKAILINLWSSLIGSNEKKLRKVEYTLFMEK